MAKAIRDRKLSSRSKLEFLYPQEDSGLPLAVTLPFFENIEVKEKKRATFKKYNLLSRPGQLYTYTGADSRKFSLSFSMCFPHILEEHGAQAVETFKRYVDSEDKSLLKALFFSEEKQAEISRQLTSGSLSYAARAEKAFKADPEPPPSEELNTILNGIGAVVDGALNVTQTIRDNTPIISLLGKGSDSQDTINQHTKVIDLVVYWTQIIRSSVCNNSENPILGPPIVRLTHGILFDNIPCICTDYSVQADESAGYDLKTLMPRRIKYTMTLEEYRAGDFSKYDGNSINQVKRDNIVGWEAVIGQSPHSMDPGKPGSQVDVPIP